MIPPHLAASSFRISRYIPYGRFECLMVQGNPVTISSGSPAPHDDHGVHETGRLGMERARTLHTYRSRGSDQLGMSIALAFERGRLAHKVVVGVFDVSSPARIREAWAGLQHVFEHDLILHGVSTEWPGFDILALDSSGALDRMIELKSSGVAARVSGLHLERVEERRPSCPPGPILPVPGWKPSF